MANVTLAAALPPSGEELGKVMLTIVAREAQGVGMP